MSKRLYAVKEIEKLLRRSADLETPTGIGGGAVLKTKQHALDGPEHLEAAGTADKLATTGHAGLLPPLSGDVGDALLGDGTWGSNVGDFVSPLVAANQAAHGTFLGLIHNNIGGWVEQASLWLSSDGINWTLAYTGSPIAASSNDRDPTLLHYDDQWFITRTGGSTVIPVFGPSADLSLGSAALLHNIDCSAISGLTACWAPKWFVDDDGSVHILFSAQHGSQTIYEVHPTNRAMTTWSAPALVTGLPGGDDIDPDLVKIGSMYYLFYKNDGSGRICLATSSSPFSGYTVIETGDWAGWGSSGGSNEGPHLVQLDDGRYRMYWSVNSGYTGVAMYYSETVVAGLLSGWTAPISLPDFSGYNHLSVYRLIGTFDHARDPDAHADAIAGLALTLKDEGTPLATAASSLDFVGAGVVASGAGAAKTVTVSGAPAGAAGGDLSGTYPNPSVVDDSHAHTAATLPAASAGGELLLSSTASVPPVFADILTTSDETDFVYSS